MLKTPELAMPRRRDVTTVCNGEKRVWTDREEAQQYFANDQQRTASATVFP